MKYFDEWNDVDKFYDEYRIHERWSDGMFIVQGRKRLWFFFHSDWQDLEYLVDGVIVKAQYGEADEAVEFLGYHTEYQTKCQKRRKYKVVYSLPPT